MPVLSSCCSPDFALCPASVEVVARMKPPENLDLSGAAGERARVDADLLGRSARGDREAFAELYDRFSRPLYATALRITDNPAEA